LAERSVADRGLGAVELDHQVVDRERGYARHDVLDGMDVGPVGRERRTQVRADHVLERRRDLGRALQVDAPEPDAAPGSRGPEREARLLAGMDAAVLDPDGARDRPLTRDLHAGSLTQVPRRLVRRITPELAKSL